MKESILSHKASKGNFSVYSKFHTETMNVLSKNHGIHITIHLKGASLEEIVHPLVSFAQSSKNF